jgi:LmbE family N-acetylglucosaminyl deacetylase
MHKKSTQLTTPEDIKRLGTILFVAAHPDDETYCAGAVLSAAVRNGQRAICVTATRGEKGIQDARKWPPEKLSEIREHELKAALRQLGVTEHHWLDYHDGDCDKIPHEEAAHRLTSLIEHQKIDSILTFGPDGLTGHPDHQAVSSWVDSAVHSSNRKPKVYHMVQLREAYDKYLKRADKELHIFFAIGEPMLAETKDCAICLKPEAHCIECKYRALRAMPSQTDSLLRTIQPTNFVGALGTEAFVEAPTSK